MSESRPLSTDTRQTPCVEATSLLRVSVDDLARVPAQRLARLLLERAAEDPTLLTRLYQTVEPHHPSSHPPSSQLSPPARPEPPRPGQTRPEPPRPGQSRPEPPRPGLSFPEPPRPEPPRRNPAAIPPRPAIVGDSPAMRQVATLLRRFEQTDEPVLITGESGTGKELLARAIHDGSRRANRPFVALNCAAIPPGLVASELFGYEKGAFTGAVARGIGQIEHANGGTLFLDEIGDMPIDLQGHLLRFLQERQIRRVGGRETIGLDVRVVSATNVRLARAIAAGRFREDLFYRLNVLTLPVPPLRDRADDIAALASHFLRLAARDFDRSVAGFTAEAMAALRRHHWPGNVRELMSVVRRAVVIGDGPWIEATTLTGLQDTRLQDTPMDEPRVAITGSAPAKPGSAEERAALLATLDRTGENITSTADALGVSRVTLYRMLRRHGIELKRGLAGPPIMRRPQHAHGHAHG